MKVIEERTARHVIDKQLFIDFTDTEQKVLMNTISDLWKFEHMDSFGNYDPLIPDFKHMQISRLELTFHYKEDDGRIRSHQISAAIKSNYELTH